MAYQLLEIVDGELTVRFEYGVHAELRMETPSWISVNKRDAYVSLSLSNFRAVVEQDSYGLAELGLRVRTDIDEGRVLVEANGPGLLRGELAVRNGAAATTQPTQPTAEQPEQELKPEEASERHRLVLVLTLAEHRALADMEGVLAALSRVFSLGGIRVGTPDGVVQRKHSMTATQRFRFVGTLHTCEFTPGGELTLEPFDAVNCECDCGAHTAEEEFWADRARLRLTNANAMTLLEFNAEAVADGVPREGCQYSHLNGERGVGVWPTQSHFPDDDDDACALVPFTPSEWRWFVACLRFYLATGSYLRQRERRDAARSEAAPATATSTSVTSTTGTPTTAAPTTPRGVELLRRAAAKHRAEQLSAAPAATATATDV